MSTTTSDWRSRERTGAPSIEARDYESTPSLLRRLVNDVGTLFAQEIALLKAETIKSIHDFRAAAISVAMGGAVLCAGLLFLLLAAVYGLSNFMEQWLAALIVGSVVSLLGVIMLMSGRKKLEPAAIAPRRTAASLRKDSELIKGDSKHERE